jgi:hypothetical protein
MFYEYFHGDKTERGPVFEKIIRDQVRGEAAEQ